MPPLICDREIVSEQEPFRLITKSRMLHRLPFRLHAMDNSIVLPEVMVPLDVHLALKSLSLMMVRLLRQRYTFADHYVPLPRNCISQRRCMTCLLDSSR